MLSSSAIKNFQDLRDWFFAIDKHGYWSIYRGGEKKSGERVASQFYDSDNKESGWQTLQSLLGMQLADGGLFTVYVASSEKDSSGYTVRFSVPIQLQSLQGSHINGVSTPEAIQAIVSTHVEQRLEAYKRERDKQDEIELLKAELQEAKTKKRDQGIAGVLNDIGNVLEENPTMASIMAPIIQGIAAKFLGHFAPMNTAMTGPTHEVSEESNPEDNNEEYTDEEMERIFNCFAVLEKHFGDPISTLEKLVAFVEKNPENAKMLINNI